MRCEATSKCGVPPCGSMPKKRNTWRSQRPSPDGILRSHTPSRPNSWAVSSSSARRCRSLRSCRHTARCAPPTAPASPATGWADSAPQRVSPDGWRQGSSTRSTGRPAASASATVGQVLSPATDSRSASGRPSAMLALQPLVRSKAGLTQTTRPASSSSAIRSALRAASEAQAPCGCGLAAAFMRSSARRVAPSPLTARLAAPACRSSGR